MLPLRAGRAQRVALKCQVGDLLLELPLGQQPVIAVISLKGEVADDERRHEMQRQALENPPESGARDHAGFMAPGGLRGR